MNIEQYRALKAEEASQKEADQTQPIETKPTEEVKETKPTEVEKEVIDKENITNEAILPEKVKIDGIGEITIDELKNGYLRQSDYTKKTQNLSKQRKESENAIKLVEQLKDNPTLFQQVTGQDPTTTKINELEEKIYDMMLEREIETLQNKYPDFEVQEVLETAQSKKMVNLEDAYLLIRNSKPQVSAQNIDIEQLKKQIRDDLIKEIQSEKDATQSIITTNDNNNTPNQDNSPKLSDAEKKVSRMMKMSEDEYAKWRDVTKKK